MNGGLEPVSPKHGIAIADASATGAVAGVDRALDDEIAALRAIVEGTARATGDAFFQSLVRHLAEAIGVSYAFVAEFAA